MTRAHSLAARLREVLLTGRWIANTNCQEQLLATQWEQATQQVGSLNTIAALTFHVTYYLQGLLHVLQGGKLEISDKYSYAFPAITSENDWRRLVSEFLHSAEEFSRQVEQLDDSWLERPFAEEKYGSYARNIEGVIEHSYYHLGQVVLIRKLLASKQPPGVASK
jgi:uncharacterized damage-inducible protein DinB